MADVPGKFFSATKVRTGVSPSSPGSLVGEPLPPVNPPGTSLNSVGLTMPSAFTVANSPLTSNGTIGVTGAGTVGQYIRGDGSLADFPESSGGGSSVSYYLNGSVNQGTIGGVAYKELNKVPILGAGTDFTINANGYIASFITDAGDPNLLEIPAGNWNFETYFSASSNGGSPSFYVELYKVNSGGTATLIASNSTFPELIAFGTNVISYFSTLAVPTTALALTDRLAIRYYVIHSGRTITLHTEDNHLCQIITTFTTGLTALNGLTAQIQNFAVGTSGTDFAISSATATHTFNLPTASATNRGALSSADWSTFNSKVSSQWITNGSDIYYSAGNVGIGFATPPAKLYVGSAANNTSSDISTIAQLIAPRSTISYPLTISTAGSGVTNDQIRMSFNYGVGFSATAYIASFLNDSSTAATSLTFGTYNGSLSEKMRLTSLGNLGIGTNTTDSYINYAVVEVGGGYTTNGIIQTNDGSVKTGIVSNSSGKGLIGTRTNHPLSIISNDNERIRIFSDTGNVLIQSGGTYTDNLARFQVNGASTLSGQVSINTGLSQPLVLNGSSNQYLFITSGVGFEAMTEYYNPTADSWYTGIRASAGLGSTSSYHIFSDTYLGDVFVLNTDGTAKFASSVTAGSFIKSGGTSTQFLKADGSVDSTTYVPTSRTITINGTSQDLSADRTYNVGTVTSVTASSPLFSSGGTTPNITIQQASGSQNGFLSSTDWTTFNSKVSSQWVTTGSNIYYNTGIVIVGNTTNNGDGPLQVNGTTTTYATFNSTNAGGSSILISRSGVNIGVIGNSGNQTVGILDDLEIRSGSSKNIHLRTDAVQFTLSPTGGAATLFSANSSTPILFLNTPGTNQSSGIVTQQSGASRWAFGTNFGSGDDSWNVYNYAASSRYLTLLSTGNVGINTSSPDAKLTIISSTTGGYGSGTPDFSIGGNISGGRTALQIYRTAVISGDVVIDTFRGGVGAAALILNAPNGGNVLIGTTSDNGAKLQVEGGAIRSVYTYNNTTASAANLVVSGGGTFERSTSSLKYKKDVRDYDKGLEVLKNLRPVYYKGKSQSDGNKQLAGLIAEEVHELGLNEFVQYANDGTPDALAYTHMVAILINSIKELKQEIDTLKN